MGDPLTIVLPVAADRGAAARVAAPLGDVTGARIGVVDNELWRSMPVILDVLEADWRAAGVASIERFSFSHLADDFSDRQVELGALAGRLDGAVTGLGN